jgi:hypothetical protein
MEQILMRGQHRLGFSITGRLSAESKNNGNRRAPRHAYNDDAWIRAEGFPLRRCRVLDLSRAGVRLTTANPDRIPDIFTLILWKNGSGLPARVKWRRHTQIGAEFAAERRPGSSS